MYIRETGMKRMLFTQVGALEIKAISSVKHLSLFGFQLIAHHVLRESAELPI